MKNHYIYIAVRRNLSEGYEWPDCSTVGILPEISRESAETDDRQIPLFTAQNPVVRIGKFELQEVAQ